MTKVRCLTDEVGLEVDGALWDTIIERVMRLISVVAICRSWRLSATMYHTRLHKETIYDRSKLKPKCAILLMQTRNNKRPT